MTALCALTALVFAAPTFDEAHAAAELHGRIGSVAAPFPVRALPEVRSEFQAYSLIACAELTLSPFRLGLRLPVATSSVEEPAGSYVADPTLGNPELFVQRSAARWSMGADRDVHVRTSVRLGVGLPIAGHGPRDTWVRNRVLAASDALELWRESELYQPGVLPLVPSGSAQLAWHRFSAGLGLKLPLLIRTSAASYSADVATRPLGFSPVVALGGAVRALPWFSVGLSTHATFAVVAPSHPARDVGRSGWLATSAGPFALFSWSYFVGRLDFLTALGGPLAGTMSLGGSAGVRLPR